MASEKPGKENLKKGVTTVSLNEWLFHLIIWISLQLERLSKAMCQILYSFLIHIIDSYISPSLDLEYLTKSNIGFV